MVAHVPVDPEGVNGISESDVYKVVQNYYHATIAPPPSPLSPLSPPNDAGAGGPAAPAIPPPLPPNKPIAPPEQVIDLRDVKERPEEAVVKAEAVPEEGGWCVVS